MLYFRVSGQLFIVSTPIGNLEDITLRAKRVFEEVDLIAAEDTRRTGQLLAYLGLKKPLINYHDFNKERRTPELISRLLRGQDIALVSDAGTPGISDPAYYLVVRAVEQGIKVVPVPGPTAFVAALVVSGLPTDRFTFEGFL
ncbi:MAG TPA: 16S rRNA (cytidine(1402)-2'-O)-methyltransferase, partial [Candidatus Latescibacteria bacterium]|nr:16S rRNA (cytidine(1402)-2'-O)-methyltransferase [Candidatus Latescibacterota bacterium]